MNENLEPPKPATYDDPRPTGRLRWLSGPAGKTSAAAPKLQAEWEITKVTLTGQRLRSTHEWRDVPTVASDDAEQA